MAAQTSTDYQTLDYRLATARWKAPINIPAETKEAADKLLFDCHPMNKDVEMPIDNPFLGNPLLVDVLSDYRNGKLTYNPAQDLTYLLIAEQIAIRDDENGLAQMIAKISSRTSELRKSHFH